MYKVTLFDNNLPGFCSGVISYYVDDVEEFKRRWIPLQNDEETMQRFLRSLQGEIVSDYYSNDPELNIVQRDSNCKIYKEKTIVKQDCYITAINAFDWKTKYYVESININLRWIKYENTYLKIAKYSSKGMTAIGFENEYRQTYCYGNKVLENNRLSTVYHSDDPKVFAEDTIASIAYTVINAFDSEEYLLKNSKRATISKKEIEYLLADIVGDAG